MKHLGFFLVLCGSWLFSALPAQAWNSIGHQAVAKIAYLEFDAGLKTKIFKILQTHPHYEKFLSQHRPDNVDIDEWVFVRASVWPDWIRLRQGGDFRGAEVTKYHRGEDHYFNIPLIDPKDAEYFAGKTLVDPDLANIVSALKQRCNEIRTKVASNEDKAVALCWVLHLIGDIHQPLHNVAYFSNSKAFVKGDLGGNKFGVRINGRKWKLHTFWDDVVGEDANYTDDGAERQHKTYQKAVTLAETLRGLKLAEADATNLAQNRTFESWSQEGFQIAKTFAYQKTDGSGIAAGVETSFSGAIPADAPEMGKEYQQKARAIAETRVQLAGQRLATRLKSIMR